jgi:MFS family permease
MAQPFVEPCDRGIIAAESCPRVLGREIAPQRRRVVLAACVLASAMAFIDGSALTVALPILRAFFDADLASVQWVLNGYILALAALTLIGGALADHYGKARMVGVGCIGFGLASAACVAAVCTENLDSDVVVMQSTKDWVRFDASSLLDRTGDRRIFIQ